MPYQDVTIFELRGITKLSMLQSANLDRLNCVMRSSTLFKMSPKVISSIWDGLATFT